MPPILIGVSDPSCNLAAAVLFAAEKVLWPDDVLTSPTSGVVLLFPYWWEFILCGCSVCSGGRARHTKFQLLDPTPNAKA